MGFQQIPKTIYSNVLDGKMSIRVQAGTPGAITRINKKGAQVHELRYDQLTGDLVGFSHRTGEFGIEFLIDLEDEGKRYQIQVPWDSRYTKEFLKCCPKFNLNLPLSFRPYRFQDEQKADRFINGWVIYQNGNRVPSAYDPAILPRFEEVTFKGKKVWDDSKHMNFLWDRGYAWALKAGLFNTVAEASDRTEVDPSDAMDAIPPEYS